MTTYNDDYTNTEIAERKAALQLTSEQIDSKKDILLTAREMYLTSLESGNVTDEQFSKRQLQRILYQLYMSGAIEIS